MKSDTRCLCEKRLVSTADRDRGARHRLVVMGGEQKGGQENSTTRLFRRGQKMPQLGAELLDSDDGGEKWRRKGASSFGSTMVSLWQTRTVQWQIWLLRRNVFPEVASP